MDFHKNPFQITSPEDLSAEETISLFVDVFTDFQKIVDPGHVFLIGPRGTGKSMMFRYLQPDCQCIARSCSIEDLPFLGIYVPLKNTNFKVTELKRLEDRHASDLLNEHILVMHFCITIFDALSKLDLYANASGSSKGAHEIYRTNLVPILSKAISDKSKLELNENATLAEMFEHMSLIAKDSYAEAFDFAKRLAFRQDLIPYDGPLCDYIDFLLPILSTMACLPGFPKGSVYLLVDDAHWLTVTQAQVLNSWVATRTSRKASLKISTQYNYKTYYTSTGATIDTPHDYSEIDITTIYTGSSKSKYRERIDSIVTKRLELYGIKGVAPTEFFPEDAEQEREIQKIAAAYIEKYEKGEGRGNKRNDDALRYARPDYIKKLGGTKKSSSTYSYAGFKQLVHLSSGIVRHFLHPAHLMYAKTLSHNPNADIKCIPPEIQNEVVRNEANNYLFADPERMRKEGHHDATPKEDIERLTNLVHGLGGLFKQILLSERSERRVISIAFSDEPSESVSQILDLGVQFGYFHRATIGRKDAKSGGRTRLFIINRRLAPIWNLDPTGFAGYLFVTNSLIEEAMKNPTSLLRRLAKDGFSENSEIVQLELFGEDN